MTQKAIYDSVTDAVLQWQDTDKFGYADPVAPTLAIEVTPDQWDSQGTPQWVVGGALTSTPPTLAPVDDHADLVAAALDAARVQRQPIIGILDGLQSTALTKGDSATAVEIETAKQALKDITKTDLSGCTTFDEMKAAMLAAYRTIAAAASPSVQLAFAGALQ